VSGFTLFVSLAAALGLGTVTSAIVNALVTLRISVEQRKHDWPRGSISNATNENCASSKPGTPFNRRD